MVNIRGVIVNLSSTDDNIRDALLIHKGVKKNTKTFFFKKKNWNGRVETPGPVIEEKVSAGII